MKVEDYEYMEDDDLEEEDTLNDERKEKLIKKVKDQIVKKNIALHKILRICGNNAEYNFIYDWLEKNKIRISGINGTLSGELKDYRYIKKLGVQELPEPLEESEQQSLFLKLNSMKEEGIDKNSKEYQEIRQKLIVHNIRLAIWAVGYRYARSFNDLGIEKEDLQQMAMEPLIKAIDGYDLSMGKKFSSYAVPTIFYTIKKEWRKSPNNSDRLRKDGHRLDRFEEEMLKSINREPTDEEIKEFLGIGDKGLKSLKQYINYHLQESSDNIKDDEDISEDELLKDDEDISEDELLKDDEYIRVGELPNDERIEELGSMPILNGVYIDDEEELTDEEDTRRVDIAAQIPTMREDLKKALDSLTPREKEILELRFGLDGSGGKTLEEIRI